MEQKTVTGKIPTELHARFRSEMEARGWTMSFALEQVITEHFENEKGRWSLAAAFRMVRKLKQVAHCLFLKAQYSTKRNLRQTAKQRNRTPVPETRMRLM